MQESINKTNVNGCINFQQTLQICFLPKVRPINKIEIGLVTTRYAYQNFPEMIDPSCTKQVIQSTSCKYLLGRRYHQAYDIHQSTIKIMITQQLINNKTQRESQVRWLKHQFSNKKQHRIQGQSYWLWRQNPTIQKTHLRQKAANFCSYLIKLRDKSIYNIYNVPTSAHVEPTINKLTIINNTRICHSIKKLIRNPVT